MNDATSEPIREEFQKIGALLLWHLGAIKVNTANPFRLVSGNYSPIYINCRALISSPTFTDLFAAATRFMFSRQRVEFDVLAGGETAGIPFAAFLARVFGLPMIYVRKAAKAHGLASQIEGTLSQGSRVLLVEDLITDAGSKLSFISGIREAGAVVEDALVVFDRLQGGREVLARKGVRLHAVTDMAVALSAAATAGFLAPSAAASVEEYRNSPREWHESRKLPYRNG